MAIRVTTRHTSAEASRVKLKHSDHQLTRNGASRSECYTKKAVCANAAGTASVDGQVLPAIGVRSALGRRHMVADTSAPAKERDAFYRCGTDSPEPRRRSAFKKTDSVFGRLDAHRGIEWLLAFLPHWR